MGIIIIGANHNRRWVSEEIFETPMFDLQDKASIKSLVRLRCSDAVDCDNVQVFFHEQVSKYTLNNHI